MPLAAGVPREVANAPLGPANHAGRRNSVRSTRTGFQRRELGTRRAASEQRVSHAFLAGERVRLRADQPGFR